MLYFIANKRDTSVVNGDWPRSEKGKMTWSLRSLFLAPTVTATEQFTAAMRTIPLSKRLTASNAMALAKRATQRFMTRSLMLLLTIPERDSLTSDPNQTY